MRESILFFSVGGIPPAAADWAIRALERLQPLTPTGTEQPLPISGLVLSPSPEIGDRRYGTLSPFARAMNPGRRTTVSVRFDAQIATSYRARS